MATKLIITPDDVRQRMQLPALDDIDNVLNTAIPAAQLRTEGFLDSRFQPASYSDLFYLDKDFNSSVRPGKMFRLYLKTGMVDTTQAVTVTYADYWNGTFVTMPNTDYKLDPVKGILYVSERGLGAFVTPPDQQTNYMSGYPLGDPYFDKYVMVTYNAGFTPTNPAPDWVKECVMAYVPVVLNSSESTNRSNEAKDVYGLGINHALEVSGPYRRNRGFCLMPMV